MLRGRSSFIFHLCDFGPFNSSPAFSVAPYSDLMEDSLRNIEPVQLGVEQMCQASVELPNITDDTG